MPDPITIRELRKNLAYHINGQKAILIGDHYHHRAILIPLSKDASWRTTEEHKAIARAAKESLRILGELRSAIRS